MRQSLPKTIVLTLLALFAFAANSVICRLALGSHAIDAANFTILRLLSGSMVLLLVVIITTHKNKAINTTKGSWRAGFVLFLYAITFSYAYLSLDTGTGALILFGAVQITMLLISMISGTRLRRSEWGGVAMAFAGFVYLILPGVSAPSLSGFLLMMVAGIAWGIYTLQGRNSINPLMDTAYNFFRTTPFIVLLAVITMYNQTNLSSEGIWLALLSGGITSGLGYTVWYIALKGLSSTLAAVLQLSVPVIAALGGVVFVAEEITFRLGVSAAMVIGGISIIILSTYHLPTEA